MASDKQELVFGDFNDLSFEEHERVLHILHGQRGPASRKVEFPWDDEWGGLTGAEGGRADIGVDPGSTHSWAQQTEGFSVDPTGLLQPMNSYPGDDPYGGQQQYGYQQQLPEVTQPQFQADQYPATVQTYGPQPSKFEVESDMQAGSRLETSGKPYERRNKKKRPPDYYRLQTGDSSKICDANELYNTVKYSMDPVSSDLVQARFTSETQMNLSNQVQPYPIHPPDPYTTAEGTGMAVLGEGEYNHPDSSHYTNDAQYRQLHTESGLMARVDDAINLEYTQNIGVVNKGADPSNIGELREVVVESVPHDTAVQPITETFHIQDHDRTSSNFGVDNNSNYKTMQTTIASPTHISDAFNPSSTAVYGHPSGAGTGDAVNVHNDSSLNTVVTSPHINNEVPPVHGAVSQIPAAFQNSGPYENSSHNVEHVSSPPDTYSIYDSSKSAQLIPSEPASTTDTNYSVSVTTGEVPVTKEASATDVVAGSQGAETPTPWKPKSWAGLFKPNSNVVPASNNTGSDKVDENVSQNDKDDRSVKELSPLPVPATLDSAAKQLGELLSKLTISHMSIALQPRGLVNRANWCYINGTLQALAACPPFYNLLKKLPKYPALSRGPSSTPILDSMVEFVNELQPMPRTMERGGRSRAARELSPGPSFEPSYVYAMLQALQVNPHFKLGRQEDAEEFLSCILDGMHEEMSAAMHICSDSLEDIPDKDGYTNGYVADADNNDEEDASDDWEQVGPKKKSVHTRRASFAKTPMSDIFAGLIRSAVYKASAKETATLEPFFTLQLDIQSESVWSVKDALEGLVSKEPITGYTCAKTNTEVTVMKKLSLEELPPVLILHLKFFVYDKHGGSQKLMKKVDYPVELEITKDILSPNAKNKLNLHQRSYKLFAVVYHHGKTSTGGHYTTAVFHPGINGWMYIDDSSVKSVMVGHVLKYLPPRVPYLLYYRRLDSH